MMSRTPWDSIVWMKRVMAQAPGIVMQIWWREPTPSPRIVWRKRMMATAAWDSIVWPKRGLSKRALSGLDCLDEEGDGTGPWDSNANF